MTVKCISPQHKHQIIEAYKAKSLQKDIASWYFTSERTVNRVLIEAGLLTPVAQLKADAYNVMQVLKKHGIEPSDFEQVLAKGYALSVTHEQVTDYLYSAQRNEIVELFYDAMMNQAFDAHSAVNFPSTNKQMETVTDDLPF